MTPDEHALHAELEQLKQEIGEAHVILSEDFDLPRMPNVPLWRRLKVLAEQWRQHDAAYSELLDEVRRLRS